MRVDVLFPDLGLGDRPTTLGQWLVDVGATVLQGDGLVEILAAGVLIELPSPVEGRVVSIDVGEDERLLSGRRLAVIETPDEPELLDSDSHDR